MAQDAIIQIKGLQCYPSVPEKIMLATFFALEAPTAWNDLPDNVHCAQTGACFRKKAKILSLQKGFSILSIQTTQHLLYITWLYIYGTMIIELVSGLHLIGTRIE